MGAPEKPNPTAKKPTTEKQLTTVNHLLLCIDRSFHCEKAKVAKKPINEKKASLTKVECRDETSAGVTAMPAKQVAVVAPSTATSAFMIVDFVCEYAYRLQVGSDKVIDPAIKMSVNANRQWESVLGAPFQACVSPRSLKGSLKN
jgi:hypothetical protein